MTLRAIPLDAGPIEVVGALELRRSPTGFSPRRLPAWTAPQIPDAFMDLMVQMTSGVRLAFRTTSTCIELDTMVTAIRLEGELRAPTVFDLVVNGEQHRSQSTDSGNTIVVDMSRVPFGARLEPGPPSTLRFDALPPGIKDIALWLPQAATVELRGLRIDADAAIAPSERTGKRWVHYGSSISHCMEAATPLGIWPAVAARRAGVDVLSLGFAGQCHLDGFVARTICELDADFISAKVGINIVNADSMKERSFVPALHAFLDTIRERKPVTPMLLVSPILCPIAEDHVGPTVRVGDRVVVLDGPAAIRPGSLTLRRIRELVAGVVEKRRALGDANLHYLDGLALFGEADVADLPDGLHPNAAGYARIGERFAERAFGTGGALADGSAVKRGMA
jgi:hypothetical protein